MVSGSCFPVVHFSSFSETRSRTPTCQYPRKPVASHSKFPSVSLMLSSFQFECTTFRSAPRFGDSGRGALWFEEEIKLFVIFSFFSRTLHTMLRGLEITSNMLLCSAGSNKAERWFIAMATATANITIPLFHLSSFDFAVSHWVFVLSSGWRFLHLCILISQFWKPELTWGPSAVVVKAQDNSICHNLCISGLRMWCCALKLSMMFLLLFSLQFLSCFWMGNYFLSVWSIKTMTCAPD